MKKMFAVRVGLLLVGLLSLAGAASASTLSLNDSNCCGSGPFGTIDLIQGAGFVDIVVDFVDGVGFVQTGSAAPGNHPDFAFTLAGDGSGVGLSVTAPNGDGWNTYDVHDHPVTLSDSFGTYMFAFYCNGSPACGPGAQAPNFGPVTFRVTQSGITPASFIPNSAGTVFVADVISSFPNGPTGLVRTTDTFHTSEVPEPATLTLVGLGLVGIAKRARRRS